MTFNNLLSTVFFFLAFLSTAFGQDNMVKGLVQDISGRPVSGASVILGNSKKGTSTDAAGMFTIAASQGSVLNITAVGFVDTAIAVGSQVNITVVMIQKTKTLDQVVIASPQNQGNELSNAVLNQQNIENTMDDYARSQQMGEGIKVYSYNTFKLINGKMALVSVHVATTDNMGSVNYGGMLPVFHQPAETKGSRFLMKDWSEGMVQNQYDSIVSNPSYLFNYDKITGDLLMTQDKQTYIEIDRAQVKSFALRSAENGYAFVRAPIIDNGIGYFQLIGKGVNYAVYKSIKTKLVKANGVSTGLTAVGNDYDEYLDEFKYYFVDLKNKTAKPFELKKKSIKEAAVSEKDKTEKFFADHKNDDIDDHFMRGLIIFLNT